LRPAHPHVTLHLAQTLDGKIAYAGERSRLSTEGGLVAAHRARAEHDAVLVGRGTLRIDDPCLTVRACAGVHPRRVLLASTADAPSSSRMFAPSDGPTGRTPVMVVAVEGRALAEDRARLSALGVEVRLVPGDDQGLVDLRHALRVLAEWGVERLLVEGGSRVLSSFLRERLADEATIEICPRWFGASGLPAVGDIGVPSAEGAPWLDDVRVERAGANVVVRGRVVY
jgi:riboflavin-specific deaminase-like protein